jgi:hypothetical protein
MFMKDIMHYISSRIAALVLLSLIMIIPNNTSYAAEKNTQKQKQTTISTQPEKITIPGEFKVKATYTLTHKSRLTNIDYRIILKEYARKPEWETDSFSIRIEGLSNGELDYYEFGYSIYPNGKKPMAVFEQKNGSPLLFIDMFMDDDHKNPGMIKVYELDDPYNHATLRLGGDEAVRFNETIGDFDGDGFVEVLNLELKEAGTGKNMDTGANFGVRSIYRYVPGGGIGGQYYPFPSPRFERVKGRKFEKYFMAHAKRQIDKIQQLLNQKKYKYIEGLILDWLATVESTQNPELIKEALAQLESLPFPEEKRKKELIKMLIRDGYPMLQQNK